MIRKNKLYIRPKHAFELHRIKEEDAIVSKYGLKNKEEIWKAQAKLKLVRIAAKKMIYASEDEQKEFVVKLKKLGYSVENPVEALSLTEEDLLKRRLQTILFKKKIATTPKGARQMIVHKHVEIGGQIINIPSYHVDIEDEKKIKLVKEIKIKKVKEESINEEILEKRENNEKLNEDKGEKE